MLPRPKSRLLCGVLRLARLISRPYLKNGQNGRKNPTDRPYAPLACDDLRRGETQKFSVFLLLLLLLLPVIYFFPER